MSSIEYDSNLCTHGDIAEFTQRIAQAIASNIFQYLDRKPRSSQLHCYFVGVVAWIWKRSNVLVGAVSNHEGNAFGALADVTAVITKS